MGVGDFVSGGGGGTGSKGLDSDVPRSLDLLRHLCKVASRGPYNRHKRKNGTY